MRGNLTDKVLSAINEIEEFLEVIRRENTPGQVLYYLESGHAQDLQRTAENVLYELNRLKDRI